jgi:hypothetical protein
MLIVYTVQRSMLYIMIKMTQVLPNEEKICFRSHSSKVNVYSLHSIKVQVRNHDKEDPCLAEVRKICF